MGSALRQKPRLAGGGSDLLYVPANSLLRFKISKIELSSTMVLIETTDHSSGFLFGTLHIIS